PAGGRADGRGGGEGPSGGAAAGRRPPHQAVQPEEAHRPGRGHARRPAPAGRRGGGERAMSVWAVILAGGSGTRFWPLSTPERPKHLLPLVGDRPLVAQAVHRLQGLVPAERVLILTGPSLVDQIAAAVPEVPAAQILVEPRIASTAPALTWAAHRIAARDPDAEMLSLHADWAVGDDAAFRAAAARALSVARVRPVAVDVAVLERTRRLAVVAGTFRWDDIGSWDALLRIRPRDARGNVVVGNVTLGDDVRRSVIWSESEHLAVIGVEDTVVVRANGHTLVTPTGRAEQIKALAHRL